MVWTERTDSSRHMIRPRSRSPNTTTLFHFKFLFTRFTRFSHSGLTNKRKRVRVPPWFPPSSSLPSSPILSSRPDHGTPGQRPSSLPPTRGTPSGHALIVFRTPPSSSGWIWMMTWLWGSCLRRNRNSTISPPHSCARLHATHSMEIPYIPRSPFARFQLGASQGFVIGKRRREGGIMYV